VREMKIARLLSSIVHLTPSAFLSVPPSIYRVYASKAKGLSSHTNNFIAVLLAIRPYRSRWFYTQDDYSETSLTPWSESASELYRPSDRRLSAKSLATFADKGCHVVSVTDPYGRILGFLDRSRYFSIK
jgi:hypothetical protein